MKLNRVAFVMALAGSLTYIGSAAGQSGSGTYSKEAIDNLQSGLNRAEKEGYVMESKTCTFFGGWLPKGEKQGGEQWVSILTLRNLDPNKEYRIVVAGDNDSNDLDLRVLDPKGEVVAKDALAQRNAEVTFRPNRQQDYLIQMRLYDSRDNCVCMGAYLRR